MCKVMVYGTLKRGYGNNRVFPPGSVYVCDAKANGIMVDLGAFPGVLKDTDGDVYGEVWEVPDMQPLDWLEGNGSFYTREYEAVETDDGFVEAWIYKLPKDKYDTCPVIDNGVWE